MVSKLDHAVGCEADVVEYVDCSVDIGAKFRARVKMMASKAKPDSMTPRLSHFLAM